MHIHHTGGLPDGDTDSPKLIVTPREGVPSVIDTADALDQARRSLEQGLTPIAVAPRASVTATTRTWFRFDAKTLVPS